MYPALFPHPNYVLRDPTEEEMRKIHSFFPDHSLNCARWMKRQGIIERNLRLAPDFALQATLPEPEPIYFDPPSPVIITEPRNPGNRFSLLSPGGSPPTPC